MSSGIVTRGYGFSRGSIITRGYDSVVSAVEEVIATVPHVRVRRGGSWHHNIRKIDQDTSYIRPLFAEQREQHVDIYITVELLSIDGIIPVDVVKWKIDRKLELMMMNITVSDIEVVSGYPIRVEVKLRSVT